jgi:hypothetical protein
MLLEAVINSMIIHSTKWTNTFRATRVILAKFSIINQSFGIIKRSKIALAFMLKNHSENLIQRWKRIHEKNLRFHNREIIVQTG